VIIRGDNFYEGLQCVNTDRVALLIDEGGSCFIFAEVGKEHIRSVIAQIYFIHLR